jgi:DNA-directed RNA polymerase specialized sigma24 family protein
LASSRRCGTCARFNAATSEVEGVGAVAERIETEREVRAVIRRLTDRLSLRRRRGGEREMTPDVEASAEPSAEEQAGEEPAAAEAPAEETAEAVSAEERAAEEPPGEEPPAEEQTPA